MTRLTRDTFLAAEDQVTEEVSLDGIHGYDGMTVLVRGMTGYERDAWEATMMERRGKRMVTNAANIRAKLVAYCAVDEEGVRLFSDGDALNLGQKSAAVLNRIYEVAARLSGITEEDVDDLAENFDKTSSDSGPSSSLNGSTAAIESSLSDSPAGNSASGTPTTSESPSSKPSETETAAVVGGSTPES